MHIVHIYSVIVLLGNVKYFGRIVFLCFKRFGDWKVYTYPNTRLRIHSGFFTLSRCSVKYDFFLDLKYNKIIKHVITIMFI